MTSEPGFIRRWQNQGIIILAAIALCALMPVHLVPTLKSNDLNIYLNSYILFSQQFWSGDLYPRWLFDANAGLGSPVFIFYGPLSGYFFSLLEFLSPLDTHGFWRMTLCSISFQIASGLLIYRWILYLGNARYALAIALFYTLQPYKITSLYLQMSITHILAEASMLWIMLGAEKMLRGEPSGKWHYTIGFAFLILAHPPSVLVFGAVPFLYMFLRAKRHERLSILIQATVYAATALLLTGFYWLVLWLNRNNVHLAYYTGERRAYTGNYFQIINDYLALPYFLLVPFAIYCHKVAKRAGETARHGIYDLERFALWLTLGIFIMVTPLSIPIIKLLPILEYLQFPVRFYNVLILPVALLAGLLYVRGWSRLPVYFWMLMIFAQAILIGIFLDRDADFSAAQKIRYMFASEYCPSTAPVESCSLDILQHKLGVLPEIAVRSGIADVSEVERTGTAIHAAVDVHSNNASIQFKHFYFPGLRVYDTATETYFPATSNLQNGLAEAVIPAGKYHLRLIFSHYEGEQPGRILTLVGMTLFLGTAFVTRNRTAV